MLDDDFILLSDEALSDAEVVEQLHLVIQRLAKHGIAFGINETVPERLAYRCLLEDLRQGMDVMPGLVLDGCDGCCEECFQLPYCETGKKLAGEYHFEVPPPIPPRVTDSINPDSRPMRDWRWPADGTPPLGGQPGPRPRIHGRPSLLT